MSFSDGAPAQLFARLLAAAELCASTDQPYGETVRYVMQRAALAAARQRGLCAAAELPDARLFEGGAARADVDERQVDELVGSVEGRPIWTDLPPETLGQGYEQLIARSPERQKSGRVVLVAARGRKLTGSFFTPPALTRPVVERALERRLSSLRRCEEILEIKVCDPALGAGAFLVEACRQLAGPLGGDARARRAVAESCLYGVDISPLAVAVAELCLWLYVADAELSPRAAGVHLRVGDALAGPMLFALEHGAAAFDWQRDFPEAAHGRGFEAVIGNPPWVAYAGRAAQPLPEGVKSYYRRAFSAFRGYPTLHGLFVERAAALAPGGVVALLLPSPVADLDGYRPVRSALARTHSVREPLLELGQDAFSGVTQPSFVLVADPGPDAGGGRAWRLSERQRAVSAAEELRPPAVLERLAAGALVPRALFGEMGFQTSRQVSQSLLLRAAAPDALHGYPLLEGRDVNEFRQGPPRLFLRADPELLRAARVRLRPEGDYQRVRFVLRQTAAVPIAAIHGGLPFRNTLLAGFELAEYPPQLMVGLLNSALYRALHLAARRDARQAVFPQVKIAHLRALPAPPHDPARRARIIELAEAAAERGVDAELRRALDESVSELFGLTAAERRDVVAFVARRLPALGHG